MGFLKPSRLFLSRLSFTRKFLFVSALLALPILAFTSQYLYDQYLSLRELERFQAGAQQLRQVNRLVRDLERFRDMTPLLVVRPPQSLLDERQEIEKRIKARLNQLIREASETGQLGPRAEALRQSLQASGIAPGSEGYGAEQLWDNANQIVFDAVELQYILAGRLGLQGMNLQGLRGATNLLLNTLPRAMEPIGQARGLGGYLLQTGYVNTGFMRMLEQNWQNLNSSLTQLRRFVGGGPAVESVRARLAEATAHTQALLDRELIQAFELGMSWRDYEASIGPKVAAVYRDVDELFRALDAQLESDRQRQLRLLQLASVSLLLLLLLIAYLLAGFYQGVRLSFEHLIDSAQRVARGDFDTPVVSVARDETEQLAEAMDRMRTELREREELLRDFSSRDGLTGLRNRYYFDEALEDQLHHAERNRTSLALLLIDLDHFKRINDIHGHLVGDQVLQHAAAGFLRFYRRKTDVVARYGGEEFAIIQPETDREGALARAEQLRAWLRATPVQCGKSSIRVTASMGLAIVHPGEHRDPKELIGLADQALYEAKGRGRDQVVTVDQLPVAGERA